jgi:hypothetical protein
LNNFARRVLHDEAISLNIRLGIVGIKFGNKSLVSFPRSFSYVQSFFLNCTVTISDDSVASPLILNPAIGLAMNLPSLDMYEALIDSGGLMLVTPPSFPEKWSATMCAALYPCHNNGARTRQSAFGKYGSWSVPPRIRRNIARHLQGKKQGSEYP